jgi:hypothetical protein
MTIRTQLNAGGITRNHNEALQVRTSLKAGGWSNHNEALRLDSYPPAISMRRQPRTTGRKADRPELLVVRASVRAGRRSRSRKGLLWWLLFLFPHPLPALPRPAADFHRERLWVPEVDRYPIG